MKPIVQVLILALLILLLGCQSMSAPLEVTASPEPTRVEAQAAPATETVLPPTPMPASPSPEPTATPADAPSGETSDVPPVAQQQAFPLSGRLAFASPPGELPQLYIADGEEIVQMTDGSQPSFSPEWSPDGSRIAFIRWGEDDNLEIYVMNPDEPGATNLTGSPYAETSFDWSPDGSRLVYSALRPETRETDIVLLDVETREQTRLYNTQSLAALSSWSGDGSTIIFFAEEEEAFLLVDVAAGEIRPLTFDEDVAFDVWPFWASQGAILAFILKEEERAAVWLLDTTTLEYTHLADLERHPFPPFAAAWSPDGNYIRTLTRREDGFVVRRIRVADGSQESIVAVPDNRVGSPYAQNTAWSPDGNQLAFVDSAEETIFVLDFERAALMPLPVTAFEGDELAGPTLSWEP